MHGPLGHSHTHSTVLEKARHPQLQARQHSVVEATLWLLTVHVTISSSLASLALSLEGPIGVSTNVMDNRGGGRAGGARGGGTAENRRITHWQLPTPGRSHHAYLLLVAHQSQHAPCSLQPGRPAGPWAQQQADCTALGCTQSHPANNMMCSITQAIMRCLNSVMLQSTVLNMCCNGLQD